MTNSLSLNDIAVILLNWNNFTDSDICIESLINAGFKQNQIVFVDNNSQDSSMAQILNKYLDIIPIHNKTNSGFASGCNLGIELALGMGFLFIWILNNDTTIDKLTAATMLEKFKDDSIGAVGSVIKDMEYPHNIQAYGGGEINYVMGISRHTKDSSDRLDFLTGCSMMIRAQALNEVGLFDESMFMYWEDADLSLRLKDAGWHLAVARESIVYHGESVSVGRKSISQIKFFNRSARIFFKKHSKVFLIPILVGQMGRTYKAVLRSQFSALKYIWKNGE